MTNPHPGPRDRSGRYTRDPATAIRDGKAADLRAQSRTYQQIADELGYASTRSAWEAVQRAIDAAIREPGEAVLHFELERLDAELARLKGLETAARAVLERHHVTVSNGQIIRLDGEPLLDDAPALQAIDRLLKIEEQRRRNGESRRKLLGLDAPSRVSVEAEQLGREISRLLDAALGPDGDGDDTDA